MNDPYGPTFPPPAFMAPHEPETKPGALVRMRKAVFVVAPVAALVLVVGVLATVIYRGEHPHTADSGPDQRANLSTSVTITPAHNS